MQAEIQPRNGYISVRRDGFVQGQIILSDPDKLHTGKIVAVGPGRMFNGKRRPIDLEVGQNIMFNPKAASDTDKLTAQTDGLLLMTEADVIGIME